MELKFQVQLKIQRPPAEVFAAVVDPAKLTGYFVQTASGPLAAGATVMWSFAEAPKPIPVTVIEVVPNERIAFEWPAADYNTRVEMTFSPLDRNETMVR